MSKSALAISSVTVRIDPPITRNFERYLLDQQRLGNQLLSFYYNAKGAEFILYFGKIGGLAAMDIEAILSNVQVAPWKLYVFNAAGEFTVKRGEQFILPRLVGDYTDMVGVDDPVEIVTIGDSRVCGSAIVLGMEKTKLQNAADSKLNLCKPACGDLEELRYNLTQHYEQSVGTDAIVSLLRLRATTNIKVRVP
jgi:hypothetical protein